MKKSLKVKNVGNPAVIARGNITPSGEVNWIKPARPAADAAANWSKYIDSRLKQFCTR